MAIVRDSLWQDPFFTSSPDFDDFRKEMLRESQDMINHIKNQFEIFDSEKDEEGNKTIVEKTEIREGYKLEKDKNTECREVVGPTTSSKYKKLSVLPPSYDSDNEVMKMSYSKLTEDNQVIKVLPKNYVSY